MATGRVIRKWLFVASGVVIVGLAGLYLLASWVPAEYQPARLNHQQRERATSKFYSGVFQFMNDGEDVKPYTWSVSQELLNEYLASMDEISYRKGGDRGQVDRVMTKSGLAEPMVVLDDGAMTILARSLKYDKIISATLRFEFTPEGKLRIHLTGARIGKAPMPASVVRERIEKLKATAVKRLLTTTSTQAAEDKPSSAGVAKVLGQLIAAIDGEPIDTELAWRLHSRKRVRIDRIDIADGKLTLHVVPVGRRAPTEGGE